MFSIMPEDFTSFNTLAMGGAERVYLVIVWDYYKCSALS